MSGFSQGARCLRHVIVGGVCAVSLVVQGQSPAVSRSSIAQQQQAAKELRELLHGEIDKAQKTGQVDTARLVSAVLGYAAQFPDDDQVQLAVAAGRFFEFAEELKMQEASEAQLNFIQAMKGSPNPRLREFGLGKERVHLMRSQPAELRITDVDGRAVSLADYRGKVVLLDFWATSCSVCVEAVPNLKRVYNRYNEKGFEIIGVLFNDSDNPAGARALVRKLELPWLQLVQGHSMESPIFRQFSFTYVPNYFLLDEDGLLVTTDIDYGEGPKLELEIRRLLGLPPLEDTMRSSQSAKE